MALAMDLHNPLLADSLCDWWPLFFRFEALSLRQAYEVVLEQRPFVRPNAGFWRQLLDYEQHLFGRTSLRMASTSSGVLPEAADQIGANYCINI